jgi:hypothetical protein
VGKGSGAEGDGHAAFLNTPSIRPDSESTENALSLKANKDRSRDRQ